MPFIVGIVILVVALVAALYAYRNVRVRRAANQRLMFDPRDVGPAEQAEVPIRSTRRFARRHYVLPWLAAMVVVAVSYFAVHVPLMFALSFGFLTGLLLGQLDSMLLTWAQDRIENQLADMIDLMISSLKVGLALQPSLEAATREARRPLRAQMEEVIGRIRLGDDPKTVLAALAARVPLESFHLFATALMVHWDVGGSLTQTLATVGHTIRDRIEISRRLNALTSQSRASIVAVMLVTYFIAALMWRHNPDRMAQFLATLTGQSLSAIALVLQGVGIVWVSYLSRARY